MGRASWLFEYDLDHFFLFFIVHISIKMHIMFVSVWQKNGITYIDDLSSKGMYFMQIFFKLLL